LNRAIVLQKHAIETLYKSIIKITSSMTKEALAKVLGLAIIDGKFRKKLKEDPEHTAMVAGLSDQELKFLKDQEVHNSLEEFSTKVNIQYDHGTIIGPNKSH
jgi:hypothetical protein